jgi:hypothetical protein
MPKSCVSFFLSQRLSWRPGGGLQLVRTWGVCGAAKPATSTNRSLEHRITCASGSSRDARAVPTASARLDWKRVGLDGHRDASFFHVGPPEHSLTSAMSTSFTSQRADDSLLSMVSPPNLSLGSLANISGVSTPVRGLRIPSSSTAPSSAPVATPSPPRVSSYIRKKLEEGATPVARKLGVSGTDNLPDDDGETDGDILNSMTREKKWDDEFGTPSSARPKRSRQSTGNGNARSNNLTLRDQEKVCLSLFIGRCCVLHICYPVRCTLLDGLSCMACGV